MDIPWYYGQVPRDRPACITILVCPHYWNIPRFYVILPSTSHREINVPNGLPLGTMVWSRARSISPWISLCTPAQNRLCWVDGRACIYLSGPCTGDKRFPSHSCILRRADLSFIASYKIGSMGSESWGRKWLGKLLCEHVSHFSFQTDMICWHGLPTVLSIVLSTEI